MDKRERTPIVYVICQHVSVYTWIFIFVREKNQLVSTVVLHSASYTETIEEEIEDDRNGHKLPFAGRSMASSE